MTTTYPARAVRDGGRWSIDVPDLPGLDCQAGRLDQAESIARAAIASTLGVPATTVDVTIEPELSSLGNLRPVIEKAHEDRTDAQQAQERASASMRDAVRAIRAAGYTSRDAGVLLGVSNQRISQLEKS